MTTTRPQTPLAAFSQNATVRRIHREGVLLIGGGRALLMQIAHPAVATGVAEHSQFTTARHRRLLRTLRQTYAIVFGNPSQVAAATRSITAVHDSVEGEGYHANDPDLLLWVLATLIDTVLVVHERFIRPLGQAEAEAYYTDMGRIGVLLALPAATLPGDLASFQRYMEAKVSEIVVSDTGRALAQELFRPIGLLGPTMPLQRFFTAGLLPPPLRRQLGLSWDNRSEASLRCLAAISRAVIPRLPPALRAPPWFLMPPANVTGSPARSI